MFFFCEGGPQLICFIKTLLLFRIFLPGASFGVYSPSTAEARHLDAAAPDSNLSYAAKQVKLHNSTHNINSPIGTTQLGIALKGGIKVLPTTSTETLNNLPTTVNTHFIFIYLYLVFYLNSEKKEHLNFGKKTILTFICA